MSDKQQKNQLVLAFKEAGRSEAPKTSPKGPKCPVHSPRCNTRYALPTLTLLVSLGYSIT
jgi:hypothetical protein